MGEREVYGFRGTVEAAALSVNTERQSGSMTSPPSLGLPFLLPIVRAPHCALIDFHTSTLPLSRNAGHCDYNLVH